MTITARERTIGFHPGVVRNVTAAELPQALALARKDPSVNGFVISRIEAALVDHWRLGGALWGFFTGESIQSMLFVGANIMPINTDVSARSAFAAELISAGRRSSSILGESDQVLDLWQSIETYWGKAREVRESQPFLQIDSDPECALDNRVRRVVASELDLLFPACVDMFTEEVGVSPIANGGEFQYKRRIAEVIDSGMAFAVIENGRVLFKTEVGFSTNEIAQLQGVWVNPSVRGQGLAAPALAAAVVEIRASGAQAVSLYVNDFNIPARKTYEHVGFKQMATFATVLF